MCVRHLRCARVNGVLKNGKLWYIMVHVTKRKRYSYEAMVTVQRIYHIFAACSHDRDSRRIGLTLSRQMFTVSNDLHTLELRDNTSNLSTIRSMKENRSNTVESSGLLLLLIGVIFAGIYRLLHQFCMWCAGCAIEERMQVIRFIHDTDGRKRNTISRWRMNW